MKLYFDDFGTGKPVVLIHAFPLSREMWTAQTKLLVNNGFRVILPDLPGFGESPVSHRISIKEMAFQIADLIETLKIERAILGGLSMGGYVSLNLFRLIPEKFSALILCDTNHLADTDEKRESRYSLITKIEHEGSSALVENMLPNLISDYTKQNLPVLLKELETDFSKVNPTSAIFALQSMADRMDSSDIIKHISVPTLLLFGEFDKITNIENARKMNQLIPNSKLVIIKNAGHYSNLEQPQQFNKALVDFCLQLNFDE